jgi:hypothetical protein
MPEKLSTAHTLLACATGALFIGVASTLVMTSKVADAQMGGGAWSQVANCDGGRALCGDRSDDAMPDLGGVATRDTDAMPDLGGIATRDTDAVDCVGGRASCGDRRGERDLARVPPFAPSPLDTDDHPRAITR